MFSKARALYCLRKFDERYSLCKRLLARDPVLAEGRSLLEATSKRLNKSMIGNFDFSDMRNEANRQKFPRLDYRDYDGPVKIGTCSPLSKGRGLFATQDVRQGEILLCEKALKFCYVDEVLMQTNITQSKTGSILALTHVLLPKSSNF